MRTRSVLIALVLALLLPVAAAKEEKRPFEKYAEKEAAFLRAIAASLACGYLGMVEGLTPSDPVEGSAYDLPYDLPRSLEEALGKLRACERLVDLLGKPFVLAYNAVKDCEDNAYRLVISSWEREYLLLNV